MKFIAYIRVSTKQQGESGLGLESQASIIANDVGEVEATFVEVASGRKADRPQLLAAIEACKKQGATLVVAKIDRLARNLSLACKLVESGVKIRVVGMPEMTTLVFQILCAVAEEESRLISARTKAALEAAKARGVKLGSARPGHWDGRQRGRPLGSKVAKRDPQLVTQVNQLRASGHSFQQIADMINAQGHRTPKGKEFSKSQVHRLIA